MVVSVGIHHILSDFLFFQLCPVIVLCITEKFCFCQGISGPVLSRGNYFTDRHRHLQIHKRFVYANILYIWIFFDHLSRNNLCILFRFPPWFIQFNIYFTHCKTVGSCFKICKICRSSSSCQCCDHCSKCDSFYHFSVFHHKFIPPCNFFYSFLGYMPDQRSLTDLP